VLTPRGLVALLLALTMAGTALGCSLPAQNTATAHPEVPAMTTEAPPPSSTDATGWDVVGTSVQGRPIRARTLGHGPRRVLFIGGIHGDEAEGAYTTDQLPAAFDAAGLADSVTLTILEDANPDGREAGTRGNAHGVDVNRNFPASNFDWASGATPLSEPEAVAVKGTIDRINPNLVLVAHSWIDNQFINFDGPAREIADRFSASSGLPVEESSAFAPTPGSLGSYFGRDRHIPILTIEVLKGSDPKAVWEKLREALLQAIAG
jgi:murein peptide amidase A